MYRKQNALVVLNPKLEGLKDSGYEDVTTFSSVSA
jgi:hypothetical protein